jgi:IS605 OrfB family transposase
LLLSACDKQQATIERADDRRRVLLRVQLPTRPDPRSYRDWTWVACPLALPPTAPAAAAVHLPTLRIIDGRVRADIAFTQPVPGVTRTGHTVALGVDWGLNTLLSAGAARLHADGRITTSGAGAQFRAGGVLAKAHRLRRNGERLKAKTDQYARLGTIDLDRKAAALAVQAQRLDARRRNLNEALAWAAARWAVDQAIAAGATVIYLEDLRSMEAGRMGRTINTRLSQTVRGRIVQRMRHIAAEVGIAVVTVPPRDTSKRCPCCLTLLRHIKAPDKPTTAGWKWATCPNPDCGWQGDRDQGAWRRITARGLTHQTTTILDHTSGAMAIRNLVDTMEAGAAITSLPKTPPRDRSKTGPTRRRTTTRPAPRRRGVPSPANAGQRPEGHVTRTPPLPRAATRNQDVHTTSNTTHRHQPKGAALGAGFHLHAHATPPRWSQPSNSHGFT